MSSDNETVERVARALWDSEWPTWPQGYTANRETLQIRARAALSAMPSRVSPELIAQLNALASRLTQMGEYEAVDLIDTVVERVTAMPQRELLAEALEALTDALDNYGRLIDACGIRDENPHAISAAKARAAADKIRASLTQEKQT